jgi:hypothetical protein
MHHACVTHTRITGTLLTSTLVITCIYTCSRRSMPVTTNAVLVARLYAKYSLGYSSLDRSVMGFFRWEGTHKDRSCTQLAIRMRTPCSVSFWQSHTKTVSSFLQCVASAIRRVSVYQVHKCHL